MRAYNGVDDDNLLKLQILYSQLREKISKSFQPMDRESIEENNREMREINDSIDQWHYDATSYLVPENQMIMHNKYNDNTFKQ